MRAPCKFKGRRGFSLAEVLLAFALISIALLALMGQSMVLVNSSQKHDDHMVAADVARSISERLVREVLNDQPAGRREAVWQNDSVMSAFDEGQETIGGTTYTYQVFVANVDNSETGSPLGTGASGNLDTPTRLKRIDVSVTWWWGDTQERAGYGNLKVESTRLLKVTRETT